MRKTVLFILSLLLAGGLFAEANITPLAGGLPLFSGPLSMPLAFPGKTGGLYLVGLNDAGLKAYYSADKGVTFAPVSIDFNGRVLSNVRELQLYERFSNDYMAFFIGTDGSGEGVFALEETTAGRLRLLNGRFDDPSLTGSLVRFDVRAEQRQGFLVSSLKSGVYSVVSVAADGALQAAARISQSGETVLSVRIQDRMDKGVLTHWGAYLSERSGEKFLVFYSVKDGRLETTVEAAGFSRIDQVTWDMARDNNGNYFVLYTKNDDLHAARIRNGRSEILNAGRALIEGQTGAKLDAAVSGTNGVSTFFRTGSDIYEAAIAGGTAANAKLEAHKLNMGAVKDEVKFFTFGVKGNLLGFIEERAGRSTLRVLVKNAEQNSWRDLSGGLLSGGTVLDFTFKVLSNGAGVLETLSQNGQNLKSSFFKFEQSGDQLDQLWEYSLDSAGFVSGSAAFYTGDTLVRGSGGNTYILNPLLRQGDKIENTEAVDISGALGMNLLASADGKFYRLSADQSAPAPAFWTFGYALQSDLGLCRLYLFEDKITGAYKVEVQRVGYDVPVWWGGHYVGDNGAYMRNLALGAGETRELNLEVWDNEKRVGVYSGKVKGEKASVTNLPQANTTPSKTRSITGNTSINLNLGAPGDYPPVVAHGTGVPVFQLTNNANNEIAVRMSNKMIVWQEYDGQDYEIVYWKEGLSAPVQLTHNTFDDNSLQTDNGMVVWQAYDGQDNEIFYWMEGLSAPIQLTNNAYNEIGLHTDNRMIVWYENQNSFFQVFFWKEGYGKPVNLRNTVIIPEPDLNDGLVVFCETDGHDSELFYWKESFSVPRQFTNNDHDDISPQTANGIVVWLTSYNQYSGMSIWREGLSEPIYFAGTVSSLLTKDGMVVWSANDGNDNEIFYWREGLSAPVQLTNNNYSESSVTIDNGMIVWCTSDGNDNEIFFWREGLSLPVQVTNNNFFDGNPQLDNGMIVWSGNDGVYSEIYFWKEGLSSPIRLSDNNYPDRSPLVQNGMVAWSGNDSDDSEIFLAYLESTPPQIELSASAGWVRSSATVTATATDGTDSGFYPETASGVNSTSWNIYTQSAASITSTNNGNTATAIITANETLTVNFVVKDRLGNESAPVSTTVRIDNTAPIITLSGVPQGWASGNVTIGANVSDTLSGVDSARIFYSIDGGALVAMANNGTLPTLSAAGTHLIHVEAFDIAGNWAELNATINIDPNVPTITVKHGGNTLNSANQYWQKTAYALAIISTATGASSLQSVSWQIRNNGMVVFSGISDNINANSITINAPQLVNEGIHTLTVTATTVAGLSATSPTYTFGYDATGPSILLSDSFFEENIFLIGLTINPVIGQIFYRAKNLIAAENTVIKNGAIVNFMTTGVVEFRPGFIVETGADVTVSLGQPSPTDWINQPGYTVFATATDTSSGVNETSWRNGLSNPPTRGGNTATNFANGEQDIFFQVSDKAGNSSLTARHVKYDATTPVITAPTNVLNNGIKNFSRDTAFTATAADAHSGLNAATWANSVNGAPATGADGTVPLGAGSADTDYNIRYTVRDNAGNTGVRDFTVCLDRTGPAVTVESSDGGLSRTASGTDAGVGLDANAEWTWTQDDWATVNTGRKAVLDDLVGSGLVTLRFRVSDRLGNSGEGSTIVTVDKVPPVVTPFVVTPDVSFNTWIGLDFVEAGANFSDGDGSGVDPATRQISFDGGATFSPWNGNPVMISCYPDSTNKTTLVFAVRDSNGNRGTAVREIWMDRKAPAVVPGVETPGVSQSVWTNAASVSVTASIQDPDSGADPASLEYSYDNLTWQAGPHAIVNSDGQIIIYFRAKDTAGNTGTGTAWIWRNTVGPVIGNAGVIAYRGGDDSLTLGALTAVDPQTPIGNWRFRFDDAALAPLPYATPQTGGVIPDTGLAEGTHILTLAADDSVGNTGYFTLAFTVDRTGPVLGRLDVLDNGRLLSDTDYTNNTNLLAQAVLAEPGETGVTYRYSVASDPTPPAVPQNPVVTQPDWAISGLAPGVNYLFVWAVDATGNPSAPLMRIVRLDTDVPGAPTVISRTHPRAVTELDAVAARDAGFEFRPTTSGQSGIADYAWRLLKGAAETGLGLSADGKATFVNLDDNEAGEYYFLFVTAVGVNGRRSAETEYRFRVDSRPPQELTVRATPQINPELDYNDAQAVFGWNKPVDMTGVQTYYFTARTGDIGLPATDAEKAAYDFTGWTATNNLRQTLALSGLVSPTEYGSVWFAVAAVDYAGNRAFAKTKINFDWVKPWLDKAWVDPISGLPTALILDYYSAAGQSCTIRRGTARDAGSGLENVYMKRSRLEGVSLIEETGWQPALELSVVQGLEPNETYLFTCRVTDNAGNFSEYYLGVSLQTGTVDLTGQLLPFSEVVCGYELTGLKSTSNIGNQIFMKVPASYGAHRHNAGTGALEPVTQFEFTNNGLQFDGNAFVSGAADAALEIDFDYAGFHVRARGLSLDRTSGLSATRITYEKQVTGASGTETRTFTYTDVAFSFPPQELFAQGASDAQAEPFGLQTHVYDGSPETMRTAWPVSGLVTSSFSQDSWLLTDGLLLTQTLFDTYAVGAYRLNADQTRNYSLSVPVLSLNHRDTVSESPLSIPFTLEFGDNEFLVERAYVKADRIVVLRAKLVFAANVTADEIFIENFSIDTNGQVSMEPGFRATGMTMLKDSLGREYLVATGYNIRFIGRNLFLDGASLLLANGTAVSLSGVRITRDGPDPATEPKVAAFTAVVHGYTIESNDARLTAGGMLLVNAVLKNMPVQFGSGDWPIAGAVISLTDNSVVTAGRNGSFERTFPTPYGSNVTIRGITLDAEGLFADLTDVTLPPFLGGGVRNFPRLRLVSDGTFGRSYAIGDGVSFNLGGFEAVGTGVTFDGEAVNFFQITVTFAGDASPNVFEFTGFRVNFTGLLEEGHSAQIISYRNSGWDFSLVNPSLDLSGIRTESRLILPYAFGGRELVFNQFRLLSSGGFESGSVDETMTVRLFGWRVEIAGISLVADLLSAETGTVELYSIMGFDSLVVPNLRLKADGSVSETSGAGNAPKSFLATNGFQVSAAGYAFKPDGLRLNGDVHFPSGLGESAKASYANWEMLLDQDGVIVTAKSGTQTNYQIAGFNVRAAGYWFDRSGLSIDTNVLEVNVFGNILAFNLPSLQFYADGNIKFGGSSFEGWQVDLFGFQAGITAIKLTNAGVNLKAFITLPENLGDVSIYFDELTLHPDGRITTDVAVKELPEIDLFSVKLKLRNIRLSDEGLSIGEGVITLPPALESRRITITGFKIKSNGDFEIGNIGLDPFELLGFTFYTDRLSIANSVISFQGAIRLPDNLVEGLSGERIVIAKFEINVVTGEIQAFEAYLDKTFEFEIVQDWKVRASRLNVEKRDNNHYWIGLKQLSLLIPESCSWLPVTDLSITDMAIDPATGEFDFSKITITSNKDLAILGFTFRFGTVSFAKSGEVNFNGAVTLPATFPQPFAGSVLTVNTFQVLPGGAIGNIDAVYSGLRGEFFGAFDISGANGATGATVGFSNANGKFTISCYNAVFKFTNLFPEGIRGEAITLNALKMGISNGNFELMEFDAVTSKLSPNLLGLIQLKDLVIGIKKDTSITPTVPGEDISISASGKLVIPNAIPITAFKGKEVELKAFKLNLAGKLEAFSAGLKLDPTKEEDFLLGLKLAGHATKDFIAVEYLNDRFVFNIAGTVIFGNSFPQGIAGTRCAIEDLVFDSTGEVIKIKAEATFVDQMILGLKLKNGKLAFDKEGASDLLIGLSGTLELPAALQQAGQPTREIVLEKFTIASSGEIKELRGRAVFGDIDLFGAVTLLNTSIEVTMREGNEIVIAGFGGVRLPASLPPGLAGLEFAIRKLEFSTKTMQLDFDVGLASGASIDFDIFAGIKASVTQLDVNNAGFAVAGLIKFPSEGFLPKEFIQLDGVGLRLAMNWDGTLTDLGAVLGSLRVSLAGFDVQLTNLALSLDGISCSRAQLTLPQVIGGSTLAVVNAGFDKSGQFYGAFEIGELNLVVAGFGFNLKTLSYDATTSCIKIGQAKLKLPDFMNVFDLTLYEVAISPSGLDIGGGMLKLPDFTVGGLGFSDGLISLTKEDGKYVFAGQARLGIPGAGSFFTSIAFTEKSARYPWGLKYATFSWTADLAGIPIGTTPLFLYTIVGSLAFGPVTDAEQMPPEVKVLFDEGTRISLGVGVRDITGGKVFQGSLRVWIDITDWDWAFQGQVSIYSGFIKAEIVAALTHVAFYGKIGVHIAFADGKAEIWLWNENGTQKFAGQAEVMFGLRKGCIIDTTILWWRVQIPWDDLWVAGGGAKIGDFKNGKSGVAGWLQFLAWKLGILLPSGGGFEFINIDDFVLWTPTAQSSAISPSSALLSADAARDAKAPTTETVVQPYGKGRARALDRAYDLKPGVPYRFVSKKKSTAKIESLKSLNGASLAPNSILAAEGGEFTPQAVGYIFFISYQEGDPEVTVTSPSGLVFQEGHPDVTVERNEQGLLFAVKSFEEDGWLVQVDKLQGEGALYGIEAKKITAEPDVILTTPSLDKTQVGDTVTMAGRVNARGGALPTVTIHAGVERGTYLGWDCATAVVAADGTFTATFDTAAFEDGEYFVWANADNGSGVPVSAYAPGSIVIGGGQTPPSLESLAAARSAVIGQKKESIAKINAATAAVSSTRPMKPVEKLTLTRREESTTYTNPATGEQFPVTQRSVLLAYNDPNGRRTRGFIVYREHEGLVDRLPVGLMTRAEIYGLNAGVTYQFSVTAIDGYGRESPASGKLPVAYGTALPTKNDFTVAAPALVTLENGKSAEGSVTLSVPGFIRTGEAFDFVSARLKSAPAWAVAHFASRRWEMNGTSLTAGFTIAAAFDGDGNPLVAAPGDYELTFEFYNLGNQDMKHQVTVTVRVVYLAPVVNDVWPKQWHTLDETSVELYGDHFYQGTSVSLNGRILAVEEMTASKIKVKVPAGTGTAAQTLVVTGPDGKTGGAQVIIDYPTYTTFGYKTHGRVARGQTGRFFFGIQNEDRFSGSAFFTLNNVPSGWQGRVINSSVREGDLGIIEIAVPAGEAAGTRRLVLANDMNAELYIDVEVVDAVTAPVIAAAVPGAALRGETVVVAGEGFGSAGTVTLAGNPLTTAEWSDSLVRFTVDGTAVSGDLVVTAGGNSSNAVWFTVKESGFNVYPEKTKVTLAAGDTVKIHTTISGVKQTVDLTVATQAEGLTASLSRASVLPNATIDLSLTAAAGIANGSYEVVITGRSGSQVRTAKVIVTVGDAFDITTAQLPAAHEGVPYSSRLLTANGEAPVAFSVASGTFHSGLYLDDSGLVRGTPRELGTRAVSVTARDAKGRTATKQVTITVEENSWSSSRKDEGRTSYNDGRAPAAPVFKWRNDAGADGGELLACVNRVFVKTSTGVKVFDADIGTQAYTLDGRVRDWVYSRGAIIILDEAGTLASYDVITGNRLWSYSGITRFIRAGELLYAQDATRIQLIQLYDTGTALAGTVRGFVNTRLSEGLIAALKGRIFRADSARLEELAGDGWTTVAQYDRPVTDLAARDNGIFVLLDDGRLHRYDESLVHKASAETLIVSGKLVVAPDTVYVYGTTGATAHAFADLALRWRKSGAADGAAGASGKLFLAGDSGLSCANMYSGIDVWRLTADYRSVVSVGERLFAISESGELACVTGAANSGAPETELVTAPAAPDGANGWYITRPAVELRATDRDTFVTETLLKTGDEDWKTYTGPFSLEEGQYGLSWYSVDSDGYREQTKVSNFRIDATAPVSTATVTGTIVIPDVYAGPVSVTLAATDGLSGLERIEYSLDPSAALGAGSATWQTYSAPIQFNTEAGYTVSYRSIDNAGNAEETRTMSFAIDTQPPFAWHYAWEEPGLAIVYLAAVDSGAGVDRIEYVLADNGHGRDIPKDTDPILAYTSPIVLTDKGKYTVFYRAVDKAGRISLWKKVTVDVVKASGQALMSIIDTALGGAAAPSVAPAVKGGTLFKGGPADANNKIKALPDYLSGASLLQGAYADKYVFGKDLFSFMALVDMDVYVFRHQESRADLSGWELVDKNFPVEPVVYYQGGADVYRKYFNRGDTVSIPGAGITGPGYGNLVILKPAESNKARITSPEPASTIGSGDSMLLACYITDFTAKTYRWEARSADGEWQTISEKPIDNVRAPGNDGVTSYELRLTVTDAAGKALTTLARYELASRAHVRLLNPAPGEELMTNEEIDIDYRAYDADGKELPVRRVTFYIKERGDWDRLHWPKLRAPRYEGTLQLKAVLDLGKGKTQEEIFTFEVVKSPKPFWIYFWPHPQYPWCRGQRETYHPDGRHYGFSRDLSRSFEWFQVKDDKGKTEDRGCVNLDGRESLTYWSGQGSFKVRLTVLVEKDRDAYLLVNNKPVKLDNSGKDTTLYSVVCTTMAEFGAIKVGGSKDAGLVDMNVERILPGAKANPDAIMAPVKGIKVSGK